MGRTMSSISFGESGSVLSGTSRPLTRRSGGRPGFRWRSEASFFVTNFRSSVRSIFCRLAGQFTSAARACAARRPEATKPCPRARRAAHFSCREREVERLERRTKLGALRQAEKRGDFCEEKGANRLPDADRKSGAAQIGRKSAHEVPCSFVAGRGEEEKGFSEKGRETPQPDRDLAARRRALRGAFLLPQGQRK